MNETLENLILGTLQGDELSAYALHDWCLERNITMLEIGKSYIVRTAKFIYTGRCLESGPLRTVLEEAAWVAETARWSVTLATGELNDVEPYPDRVILNTLMIEDAAEWNHPLPRLQK